MSVVNIWCWNTFWLDFFKCYCSKTVPRKEIRVWIFRRVLTRWTKTLFVYSWTADGWVFWRKKKKKKSRWSDPECLDSLWICVCRGWGHAVSSLCPFTHLISSSSVPASERSSPACVSAAEREKKLKRNTSMSFSVIIIFLQISLYFLTKLTDWC